VRTAAKLAWLRRDLGLQDNPMLDAAGVKLGESYPRPMVDHRIALAAYRRLNLGLA
jgi:deoxyribodipyrimidine photolyase